MKLELDISDELWKRIEHRASLFNTPPAEFVRGLLEQHVPQLPDPDGAAARIAAIRAAAGPEDDYDMDEFLEALERNRGRRPAVPEANGEPRS